MKCKCIKFKEGYNFIIGESYILTHFRVGMVEIIGNQYVNDNTTNQLTTLEGSHRIGHYCYIDIKDCFITIEEYRDNRINELWI